LANLLYAVRCRPFVLLSCLLLTPFDALPLLQGVFAVRADASQDDDSASDEDDEMLDLTGEAMRSFTKVSRPASPALLLYSSREVSVLPAQGPPRPPSPGGEHARRNGIGTPLLC
jgi:hypothetical protein